MDRASDVTGLVDTGELGTLVPESGRCGGGDGVHGGADASQAFGGDNRCSPTDANIKQFNKCGYVKSAYLAERFNDPASLNPGLDPRIVGPTGIFTQAEYDGDGEFRKTAAVMKMVIDGNAGAGTIQMGGFDYHTGDRVHRRAA